MLCLFFYIIILNILYDMYGINIIKVIKLNLNIEMTALLFSVNS
jgi:hypothetical protein